MMPPAWTKATYCLLLEYTPELQLGWKMQIYMEAEIRQAPEFGVLRRVAWGGRHTLEGISDTPWSASASNWERKACGERGRRETNLVVFFLLPLGWDPAGIGHQNNTEFGLKGGEFIPLIKKLFCFAQLSSLEQAVKLRTCMTLSVSTGTQLVCALALQPSTPFLHAQPPRARPRWVLLLSGSLRTSSEIKAETATKG